MPVVSNTSPILNLAIIGHLTRLRQQFREIWIPPIVLQELRVEEDLPGSESVRQARQEGWIQVEPVVNQAFVQVLRRDLDPGEAEAIALAVQMQAEWLLLDEREGRRVAKALGLPVTGILGILLRARREGALLSIREAIWKLRDEAGFRIASQLLNDILKECGEEDE